MSIAESETGLTIGAQDIVALKHADDVVFRVENGEGAIEARLRTPAKRITSARDQILFPEFEPEFEERTRHIPVEGSVATMGYFSEPLNRHAVTVVQSAPFSSTWQSLADILNPRDRVALRFRGDEFTNDLLRKAGLHADTLHIEIHRGRNTKMTFLLDVRVAHDNSARMVRMS